VDELTLPECDWEALQQIKRVRKHKLGWLLFWIMDDIAAGAVIGLTVGIGSCVGIGVVVVVEAARRGTGVMLAASLVPLMLYLAIAAPTSLGMIDLSDSRHPHLYPSLILYGFVVLTLAYWAALLSRT
jgi:hypothetical protein